MGNADEHLFLGLEEGGGHSQGDTQETDDVILGTEVTARRPCWLAPGDGALGPGGLSQKKWV